MSVPETVRGATFALLRAYGMTTIFGNPGSTELPMFRDLPDDFRYVPGLQESVALGLADGYAQATGNAALVNLHSATGVGHAMGALFTAYRNRSPIVVVSGQQSRPMLAGEPYLFSEDAAALPRPYVKWSREPARAEDVPAAMARAYHVAMSPPRGPVLVSVPADDWDRPAAIPLAPRTAARRLRADPEELARVGRALAAARRPTIVVGAEVDQDGAFAEVVALAEAHRARVWAAPMSSRCCFPESHRLFAGFLPPTRQGIAQALDGSDVVLVLGAPVFTYHVDSPGPELPDGAALYQLTDDPQRAAWTPVGTSVVTSMRQGVLDLMEYPPLRRRALPPRRPGPKPVALPVDDAAAITPEFLVRTLARLRPPGSVIVEEAPSTRPVMCAYLPNDEPGSFHTCASGGLGHGLPAAVGMMLARPDRRVIAVIGDGSAMYAVQALWNAARLGVVPLTVIIVANGVYRTLYDFAERFGVGKPVGSDLPGLDFVGLALAQGCRALRVERPEELEPTLRTALTEPGPACVVEVRVVERVAG